MSIQGESTYAGLPCIFIRFAKCNLRCSYCDSKYSYQTEFSLSIEDILKKIQDYNPVDLVEITGGEPLLQDEVYSLIDHLNLLNYRILLETNGSISLEKVSPSVIKIMDIKCPASGEEKTFKKSNLKFLIPKQDEIKFVISDRNDYEWMKQKIREYDISHHKIIISCVFQKLEPAILAQWILEDKLPHRMQLQLQKYIWTDQKKGV